MGDHSARMIRTLLIASLAALAATEAEPKADPYLVYGGYPFTDDATVPLTLPYGGLYNYGYTGYPVVKSVAGKTIVSTQHSGLHYYGKREAADYGSYGSSPPADPCRPTLDAYNIGRYTLCGLRPPPPPPPKIIPSYGYNIAA